MVSKIKIFFMVFSLILLIAMPIVVVMKNKKHPRMGQSFVAGLGIFFIFSILMSVFTTLLFGTSGLAAIEQILMKSMVQATLVALTMTLAMFAVLKWYRKQEVTTNDLMMIAVFFTFLGSVIVITGLFSNIAFSITANNGGLAGLVSETHSLESLNMMAKALNDEPIFLTLYWAIDRILDIVVMFFVLYLVNKSFKEKQFQNLAFGFLYLCAVRSITNVLILSFDSVFPVFIFQVLVAVASLYYLYKYEGIEYGSRSL